MWKVMGRDTFAREAYPVGEYPTRRLAEQAADAAERRQAELQDEPLRDQVWIVPPEGEAAPHGAA
jgi:hypothetical protein